MPTELVSGAVAMLADPFSEPLNLRDELISREGVEVIVHRTPPLCAPDDRDEPRRALVQRVLPPRLGTLPAPVESNVVLQGSYARAIRLGP